MKRVYRKRRTREEQQHQGVPLVEVGQVDPMTIARRNVALPACLAVHSDAPHLFCTRAPGHDDSGRYADVAPRLHVAADAAGTALATWDVA